MNKNELLRELKRKRSNNSRIYSETERKNFRNVTYETYDDGGLNSLYTAIEELSELQQAITKYLRFGIIENNINITEEIADVEIVLSQIKEILNIDLKNVEYIKDIKYERQNNRNKNMIRNII